MKKVVKPELSLRISLAFCFLIGAAFSLKNLREPDLWWQISTGEWIIANGSVPKLDTFSYTFSNVKWLNIKWGFEVIAAFITSQLGTESVFILQVVITMLILMMLLKLSRLFWIKDDGIKPNENHFLFCMIPALLISIITCEFRMIGRPEMFSHLFTIVFIYLFERNKKHPSKAVYLIPFFQLLWANLHEAFGTGLIIILIYLIVSVFQKYFSNRTVTNQEIKQQLLILALSILAICINPNGTRLLLHPLNIFSQLQENKFTTELIGFTDPLYWKKESYLGIFIFILICFGFIRNIGFKNFFRKALATQYLAYFICLLAFLFLSLTAYRNWPFIILTGVPLTAISFEYFFNLFKFYKRPGINNSVILLISVFLYFSIVSNNYYKFIGSRDVFGLEVNSVFNPIGGAEYIKSHIGKDKKCFADYLNSSCLLHELKPDFKTFIDLRDLDIFPKDFFMEYLNAVAFPTDFYRLDSIYKFDYVVLSINEFRDLHKYLYNDSIYACTYIDPVVAIYEKTDVFSRTDIFSDCKPVNISRFSYFVNKLFNPFYHSFNYRSIDFNYIAADYYLRVLQFKLALNRAIQITNIDNNHNSGFEITGQVYSNMALAERESTKRNELMDEALNQFKEALRKDEKNTKALIGKGDILFYKGNFQLALVDFEKCIHYNTENINAYLNAAECCARLLQQNPFNGELSLKMIVYYEKALKLNPGDTTIEGLLGLAYCSINKCAEAKQYLSPDKNYNFRNDSLTNMANQCLSKCK